MDNYFEWSGKSDERRVRFARMKLQGSVKIFWPSVERTRETIYGPYRDLGRNERELKENYRLLWYWDCILDQLNNLGMVAYLSRNT